MGQTNITYDNIRKEIVEYLKKQEQFKDINYVAPAISTLIDALAYVSSYLTTYANFSINEVFLQTAQKRSSVVSKALNLGYIPRQYTAAFATIRMRYTGTIKKQEGSNPDVLSNYVIPKGTTFSVTKDGITYYFSTKENTEVKETAQGYYYADCKIYEGRTVVDTFTQNDLENVEFILSNQKVDLSTLEVRVFSDTSDKIGREYGQLEDIVQLTAKSNPIYNIEENVNGNIQLYFGDGIQSEKIKTGMIVQCTYDVVSGSDANNLDHFLFSGFPLGADINNYFDTIGANVWTIEVLEPSQCGSDREGIEEIRRNAPRAYQRQYRNVTADDYKADILSTFGDMLGGVNVWGGENNVPPQYGSVMICAKPKVGEILTEVQKQAIMKHLRSKSVLCMTPVIIDPSVIYVDFNIEVTFKKQQSGLSPITIQNRIFEITRKFFIENATAFDAVFNYSKFLNDIFQISSYITDVFVQPYVSRFFTINYRNTSYDFKMNIPVKNGSVVFGPYFDANLATEVTVNDNNGILEKRNNGIFVENVGTVEYDTGHFVFSKIKFTSTESIQMRYQPMKQVFAVSKNEVFSLRNIYPTAKGV